MELGRHSFHHQLRPAPCPECQQMPIGGMTPGGLYMIRCKNTNHANMSQEGTEARAIEKWNEWVLQTQKIRAARNPKDYFWFLRLRADVLKCCGNPDNLVVVASGNGNMLATCTKCNRKHRYMHSEPGIYGLN